MQSDFTPIRFGPILSIQISVHYSVLKGQKLKIAGSSHTMASIWAVINQWSRLTAVARATQRYRTAEELYVTYGFSRGILTA